MNEAINKKIAKYYFMGLNSKEIAKLLDLSTRTVQRYVKNDSQEPSKKQTNTRKAKVLDYVGQGFSYSQAAKRFSISRTTVYNWVRAAKPQPNTENE